MIRFYLGRMEKVEIRPRSRSKSAASINSTHPKIISSVWLDMQLIDGDYPSLS